MTPSCVSHARRAVPMCCPPPADHRARPIGACHAADIRYSEQATTTRSRCRHLPAALIVASDSLCANSMALGGRAGDNSGELGDIIGCVALELTT